MVAFRWVPQQKQQQNDNDIYDRFIQ